MCLVVSLLKLKDYCSSAEVVIAEIPVLVTESNLILFFPSFLERNHSICVVFDHLLEITVESL